MNRAKGTRTRFKLYLWKLRQEIPQVAIPLSGDDLDVTINVRGALERAYDFGGYSRRIDYAQACQPPLPDHDQRWSNGLFST